MPGRKGYQTVGGWAGASSSGGASLPQSLTLDNRTGGDPLEYKASYEIDFVPDFSSASVDNFEAYITQGDNGSGGEGGTIYGTGAYRYGFNGKENDDEVKGEGAQQDYGMRIYDPRLGRFLSVDPLTKKFASLTPYQFASNTPIWAVDLDGAEAKISNDNIGEELAITTVMGVWEVRNSVTNMYLRLHPVDHEKFKSAQLAKIGITDPEVAKHFQLRMHTVVVAERYLFHIPNPDGTDAPTVERTYSREWILEPVTSLGKELIETGLDILNIATALSPTGSSPVLLARGSGAFVVGKAKFLFHPRAFLKGFHVPLKMNGAPDFRKFLSKVGKGQKNELKEFRYTGNYSSDFKKADELAGFSEANPRPANTTWHHVEDYNSKTGTGTMQIVQQDVHRAANHSGGAAQYRAANNGKGYGK